MVKEKTEINRLKLGIIFGFAWFIPQLILTCFPENYYWIKIPILVFSMVIILFTNIICRWLVK